MFDNAAGGAPGLTELAAAVAAMGAVDPRTMPPVALGDTVVELRRLIDGLEGVWSRMVAVLDGSGAIDGGTAAFLRSSCRLSPSAARSRVTVARRLAARPGVAAALVDGAISVEHARLVTTALTELAEVDEQVAADTETPLLAAARRLDPTRLRREIAHARHALVPEVAAASDEAAHRRRHLDVAATFEGAVAVSGTLDAEGGETLLTALTALSAPAGPDDRRTPGQRRADSLVELCRRRLDRADLPALGGERPHLTVLVPLATLTGTAIPRLPASARPAHRRPGDRAARSTFGRTADRRGPAGSGPAEPTWIDASIPERQDRPTAMPSNTPPDPPPGTTAETSAGTATGTIASTATGTSAGTAAETDAEAMVAVGLVAGSSHGMVGGETGWGAVLGPESVRRVACDAAVTRVVLDPQSQPLDVGRRTRVIPPAIRTALAVRDRGCVWPGCDRPPHWTDAHHVVHWADGGSTSMDNLVLLCRRHHRTVHEGRSSLPHAPPRAA